MNRSSLDKISRTELIALASRSGTKSAELLTKAELVDEILLHDTDISPEQKAKFRGFFGLARDLLARVVEKGLHSPSSSAAHFSASMPRSISFLTENQKQKMEVKKESFHSARDIASSTPLTAGSESERAECDPLSPLPTVTLAEIYLSQGYPEKARITLEQILAHEPENKSAKEQLESLFARKIEPINHEVTDAFFHENDQVQVKAPPKKEHSLSRIAVESPQPSQVNTTPQNSLTAHRFDVDECVALYLSDSLLFVYWEICEETLAHFLKRHPSSTLCLRVLFTYMVKRELSSLIRDIDLGPAPTLATGLSDQIFFNNLLPYGAVKVAIGALDEFGFAPFAYSDVWGKIGSENGAKPLLDDGGKKGTRFRFEKLTFRGFEKLSVEDQSRRAGRAEELLDHARKNSKAVRNFRDLFGINGPEKRSLDAR